MDELFSDQIRTTATNSNAEGFRLERLQRVIGYVCALAEPNPNAVFSKVDSLHDHKGLLTVTWKHRPSDEEKVLFSKAWNSIIGDGNDAVEHTNLRKGRKIEIVRKKKFQE